MRQHRVRHGKICGERQCGVAGFGLKLGPEGQCESAGGQGFELLLGRVDPRGTAPAFRVGNTLCQIVELRRQIVVANTVISELGAAADDRAFDTVEADRAVGGDANDEHDGGP